MADLDAIPLPAAPPALPVLGVAPPERADAARNRRRILRAAAELVEEHGVDQVTMDAVAARAGVGKGTLFRRFGDRSNLLLALLSDRDAEFQEAFIRGPAPLGPGAAARDRLIAFGEGLLEWIDLRGELLRASTARSPGGRYRSAPYHAYRAHVTMLLREAAPLADADYLADVLLAAVSPDLFLHQRDDRGMSCEQACAGFRALVDAVVDG